jgi:adenylate kinase
MLVKQYDFVHIKTSTLLEREIQKQTATGIQAQPYVDRGQLVPDQLITNLIFKELKEAEVIEKGYVLDGYPRTKQQAMELLQSGFLPDHVIDVDLPDQKIIEYSVNGRVNTRTNRLYNLPQDKSTRNSIIINELNSENPCPPVDLAIIRRKLDEYRKNHQALIPLFRSNYRRFHLDLGFEGQEQKLLQDMQQFLGTLAVSKAPRSFRIIVGGLPGAGKTTVADAIGAKFGAVVVSPKSVMLQAISAGHGQDYVPYISNPNLGSII